MISFVSASALECYQCTDCSDLEDASVIECRGGAEFCMKVVLSGGKGVLITHSMFYKGQFILTIVSI